MTLTDACNSLPPRPTVNKLLSVYFNSMHSQTRKQAVPITKLYVNATSDPSHRKFSQGGTFYTIRDTVSEH